MKTLTNGTICVDKSGSVGIIGDELANGVIFFPFDHDGNTAVGKLVEPESLAQATKAQIPASRMLPDAQLADLGYVDAATPPPLPSYSRFDKAE